MSTAIDKQTGIGLAICAVLAIAPLAIFRLAGLTGEGWFLVQTVIQASAVIIGGVLLSRATKTGTEKASR